MKKKGLDRGSSTAARAARGASTFGTVVFGCFIAIFAGDCAIGTQRFGRVIDAQAIAKIEVGKSTKQDVLDLFGPPAAYTRAPGGARHAAGALPGAVATPPAQGESGSAVGSPGPTSGSVEPKAGEDVFAYEYREENEKFVTVLLYTYFKRDTIADTLLVFFDPADVVKYVAFAKQTDAGPAPSPESKQ